VIPQRRLLACTDPRLPEKVGKPVVTEMLFQHIKKLGMAEVVAQMGKKDGGKDFVERLVEIHKRKAVTTCGARVCEREAGVAEMKGCVLALLALCF
jgi:hypothetical protein